MLTNIRIDSNSINKISMNERSYDLIHNSLHSYPIQFRNYLTTLVNPTLTEDRMKKLPFNEYSNEDISHYPTARLLTFCSASTSSFLNINRQDYSFNPTLETFQDLYPIAVRWTNGKNLWLIERPPFKATITFRNTRSNRTSAKFHTFDIWVPWTAMLLFSEPEKSHYNAWLYFNDGPINSIDDILVPCFYPNMYNDARMCLNQTSVLLQQHLAELNKFDIKTVYNFIINDYMAGGWNLDLGISIFDIAAQRTNSSLIKKIYSDVTSGSLYLRNSKKVLSFLKYFSNLSLEEVTSVVTEMKSSFPVPVSNLLTNFHNQRLTSSPETQLGSIYYYPEHYSDTALLAQEQGYPIHYNYAAIIESSYANTISYSNFSNRVKYLDANSQQTQDISKEFFNNLELFSNRVLDFLLNHNESVIQDTVLNGRSYMDYKTYRENPYILVTEDSIEFITSDMSDEYFITKLTEKVSANV